MTRKTYGLAALALALSLPAHAQTHQVEWRQTLNTPKGLNMPVGVVPDILGVQVGDTYAEAKAKLEKLVAEGIQKGPPPELDRSMSQAELMNALAARSAAQLSGASDPRPLVEETSKFTLRGPGSSSVVAATYISNIRMRRELKGATNQPVRDQVEVYFSAPSSSHQLTGISRTLSYNNQNDEPRLSEFLPSLKQKFGADPAVVETSPGSTQYRYQFNNGISVKPKASVNWECVADGLSTSSSEAGIAGINRTGECDVVLIVNVTYGLSRDHIKQIEFRLGDNERTKLNKTADYAFFQAYVADLQKRAGGTAPKL